MATSTTTGSTKSAARSKAKTTAKGQATKTRNQAKRTASTAKTQTKRTATTAKTSTNRTASEASKTAGQAKGGVVAVGEYVKQAVETAVDVPVGAALTTVDRVGDINVRFNTPHKREVEIRRVRNQLRRELNKVERRGGTARRRALQSAKRTRNRVEREVKRNRTEASKRVREVSERVRRWSSDHLARVPAPSQEGATERGSRRNLLAPYPRADNGDGFEPSGPRPISTSPPRCTGPSTARCIFL